MGETSENAKMALLKIKLGVTIVTLEGPSRDPRGALAKFPYFMYTGVGYPQTWLSRSHRDAKL